MASHQFFVMIKPDGVSRGLIGEIIRRFERKGFVLKGMKMVDSFNHRPLIETHYEIYKDQSFYSELISFITSGYVVAMIWEGNIKVARKMIGETLPWEAEPGTIRGDYACKLPHNLIHCSDGVENAKREVELWEKVLV